MDQQCYYVGLDVSLETTSICVIDDAGAIIWRGKCSSDPDTITAIVRQHARGATRVGLETGQLSNWLTLSLRRRGGGPPPLDSLPQVDAVGTSNSTNVRLTRQKP